MRTTTMTGPVFGSRLPIPCPVYRAGYRQSVTCFNFGESQHEESERKDIGKDIPDAKAYGEGHKQGYGNHRFHIHQYPRKWCRVAWQNADNGQVIRRYWLDHPSQA